MTFNKTKKARIIFSKDIFQVFKAISEWWFYEKDIGSYSW